MSADVFDTNSHFPICCLIEHDEWLESEKRRDKWQHLGSIACPIDSPSLLLLQPSWLLCPPHKPFCGGGSAFQSRMRKGKFYFNQYNVKIKGVIFYLKRFVTGWVKRPVIPIYWRYCLYYGGYFIFRLNSTLFFCDKCFIILQRYELCNCCNFFSKGVHFSIILQGWQWICKMYHSMLDLCTFWNKLH